MYIRIVCTIIVYAYYVVLQWLVIVLKKISLIYISR